MRNKILSFAAVYLGWGSTYLAIRVALESLPPFAIGGIRFLSAGLVLYLWARARGAGAPTGKQWSSALLIGGLLFLIGNGAVIWSEQVLPSSIAALLVTAVPIFVALLRWERPGPFTAVGMLGGMLGVALLVRPGTADAVPVREAFIILVGCIAWAAGSLYARRAPLPESKPLGAAMEMLCGGALLMLASFLSGEWNRIELAEVSLRSLAAVGYLATVGSIIAFNAYLYLLRTVSPEHASTYAYVNPIVAVVLGVAVGGESLSAWTVISAAIIIGSVTLMLSPRPARDGLLYSTGSEEKPTLHPLRGVPGLGSDSNRQGYLDFASAAAARGASKHAD